MESECEVFVRVPSDGRLQTVVLKHKSCVDDLLDKFLKCVPQNEQLDWYVLQNGFIKHGDDQLFNNETFDLCCRLRGGKGGFGSMLRAIGAQIEKTTNREACRDLSGRRLRAINDERRVRHYARLRAQREIEREERRKKKLESLAKSEPHHEFNDEQYLKDCHEIPESVTEAVEHAFAQDTPGPSGIEKASKIEESSASAITSKTMKGWMGDLEGFEDTDSESESQTTESDSAGVDRRVSE